jgi:hypothetical protein
MLMALELALITPADDGEFDPEVWPSSSAPSAV